PTREYTPCGIKRGWLLPDAEEDIVCDFLGQRRIVENRQGQAVDRCRIAVIQDGQGNIIVLAHTTHQRPVPLRVLCPGRGSWRIPGPAALTGPARNAS